MQSAVWIMICKATSIWSCFSTYPSDQPETNNPTRPHYKAAVDTQRIVEEPCEIGYLCSLIKYVTIAI